MLEAFRLYINHFISITDEDFAILSSYLKPGFLRKKELLVQAGTSCSKVVYFNSGYFRFFHHDTKGNEITSDFSFAPNFATSYTSLLSGQPSVVNVQAMENIEILELKKSDLLKLYDYAPQFERLGRKLAELVAINSERHLFLLLNQTAEYRYRKLLEKYPEYIQTIPLQFIASYLGITQETLSRMRKTI